MPVPLWGARAANVMSSSTRIGVTAGRRRASRAGARGGSPPAVRTPTGRKAELRQQAGQRAARVEVQMVAERRSQRLDAVAREPRAAVAGGGQQQPPPGDEHAPELRQPAAPCRPRARSPRWPRRARRHRRQTAARRRTGPARSAARGGCGGLGRRAASATSAPVTLTAGIGQHPGETSIAAADVERAVAAVGMREQEVTAQREIGRLGDGGQALPQLLVVLTHGASIPPRHDTESRARHRPGYSGRPSMDKRNRHGRSRADPGPHRPTGATHPCRRAGRPPRRRRDGAVAPARPFGCARLAGHPDLAGRTGRCATPRWPPATGGSRCRSAVCDRAPGVGPCLAGRGRDGWPRGGRRLSQRRRLRPPAAGPARRRGAARSARPRHRHPGARDSGGAPRSCWPTRPAVADRLDRPARRRRSRPGRARPARRGRAVDRHEGGPVIGFVGRIEPRKGTLDLVRAAPAIRRGAPGRTDRGDRE